MEKLFHKINKYSYKLGNSIKDNDIQKIDIYTKHHIHHFEQCGKAIIQSGGNIDEFKRMLGEYIEQVNALVAIYTVKLQQLPSLKQQKTSLEKQNKHIVADLLLLQSKQQEQEKEIQRLQKEVRLRNLTTGGSIKNNDMGAKGTFDPKGNMHYIQQYGKAIIQSGGTIEDLKASLEGYITTVAQFLEKYNAMIQEHNAVTAEINDIITRTLVVQQEVDEVSGMNTVTLQKIAVLESELTNESIKTVIDRTCPDTNMTGAYKEKEGQCYKNIEYIREVLHKLGFSKESKSGMAVKNAISNIFELIRKSGITEFTNTCLSQSVPLQSIGLANIKVILGIMNVQVVISGQRIDATDGQFNDVNLLLTNNRDAISAIADFFYKRKIIPKIQSE
jgi:hypothetical protein